MGMMDRVMGIMMGRMSKGEKGGKGGMMGKMMEKFFADMTAEDKQKMMGMMGGGEGEGGMMGMMPQCLKVMLPNMPQEKRIDFMLEIVATLMEHGCADMSNEEKEDLVAKMIEKVNA